MITNLFKREEKYLSWEEYKKKMIEIRVIGLIEQFMKQNINYSYSDLDDIKFGKISKIGGVRNERNILERI